MYRTLTAAVALAAGLGIAGLAQAQSSAGPSTTPNTMSPATPSTQMNAPNSGQNPRAMENSSSMSRPSAGTYGSQANSQNSQMNQNGQQENASQADIQQAQQQLKQQGLYKGSVDGVMGPETQQALMKFQHEQGLPETAQLDQPTLGKLSGSNAGSGTTQNMGAGTTGMTTQPPSSQYGSGMQSPSAPTTNR